MRIDVNLSGLDALIAKLRDVEQAGEAALIEVITDIATDTHALAVEGIQTGPKSGRVYRRGGVTHQASAAGQYPASDTGRLAASVRMELPTAGDMTGRVGTAVEYGPFLEFGTSKMAARPWLLRSFEEAKVGVERELKARFEERL